MLADPGGPAPAATAAGSTVYLIHFDQRYAHAGHYLGSTSDLPSRLADHQAGRGARLMEVITEAGISWHVSRTWPGGRDLERALKDRHDGPRLGPDGTPRPNPATGGRAARQAPSPAPAPAAAPRPRPDPRRRGAAMAGQFLASQAGRTAADVEATYGYITGPWRAQTRHSPAAAATFRGYAEVITAHLDRLRQAEAEREAEAGA